MSNDRGLTKPVKDVINPQELKQVKQDYQQFKQHPDNPNIKQFLINSKHPHLDFNSNTQSPLTTYTNKVLIDNHPNFKDFRKQIGHEATNGDLKKINNRIKLNHKEASYLVHNNNKDHDLDEEENDDINKLTDKLNQNLAKDTFHPSAKVQQRDKKISEGIAHQEKIAEQKELAEEKASKQQVDKRFGQKPVKLINAKQIRDKALARRSKLTGSKKAKMTRLAKKAYSNPFMVRPANDWIEHRDDLGIKQPNPDDVYDTEIENLGKKIYQNPKNRKAMYDSNRLTNNPINGELESMPAIHNKIKSINKLNDDYKSVNRVNKAEKLFHNKNNNYSTIADAYKRVKYGKDHSTYISGADNSIESVDLTNKETKETINQVHKLVNKQRKNLGMTHSNPSQLLNSLNVHPSHKVSHHNIVRKSSALHPNHHTNNNPFHKQQRNIHHNGPSID